MPNNDCPRVARLWRACKFEPRYDRIMPSEALESIIEQQWQASPDDKRLLVTSYVYRGDVCVRCGKVVNSQPASE